MFGGTVTIDVDAIPYWPTHCNDAMQFIESRQLMEYVKSEHDFCLSAFNNSVISESWEDAKNCSHYFVFIYQCLHCQMKKSYIDQRVIMTN